MEHSVGGTLVAGCSGYADPGAARAQRGFSHSGPGRFLEAPQPCRVVPSPLAREKGRAELGQAGGPGPLAEVETGGPGLPTRGYGGGRLLAVWYGDPPPGEGLRGEALHRRGKDAG